MDLANHMRLGKYLALAGAAIGAAGGVLIPVRSYTLCDSGGCTTTAPGPLSYAVAAFGGATLVLGLLLVYLAWRRMPRGYLYP